MSNDNDDTCPDFFKDPIEEESLRLAHEAEKLFEKHRESHDKALAWSIAWLDSLDESEAHPEEEAPQLGTLVLGELMKITCVQLEMLSEIRKLNKNKG